MQLPGGSFEIIAPDEIRSEKISFKDMIIRCLDRIHILASQIAEKNTRASISAYEESIATLHSYLAPYYSKAYNDAIVELAESLGEFRQGREFARLKELRKWLGLIVRNLGRVGILPPIDILYDMSTTEQVVEEEKEEFLRVMRKLIKRGEREVVVGWLRTDGVVEKKKVFIKKPKIEDILDPSYLEEKKDGL